MRLAGKAAVVTGAASGIGLAIARRFAAEGAGVLAVDLDGDALARADQRGDATRWQPLVVDLTAPDAPARVVAGCLEVFGRLDVLVNNAGIGNAPAAHETDDATLDRFLALNLRAVFRLSREAIAPMRAQGGGTIVNIASVVGLVGVQRTAAYAAAKGGVIALTRQMACEYGAAAIRVNAIAPGAILTPLNEERLRTSPAFRALYVAGTPLGRVGRPDDVAGAAVFLCSDEAGYITGQILCVDGGWSSSRLVPS